MKIKRLTLIAFAICASTTAFAATQGDLSSTSSSAIFRNVFGETLLAGRQIQVTQLKDAVMNNSSPQLNLLNDPAFHGVRDKFCVTDTTGANVRITFNPTNLAVGDWNAKAADGTYHQYYLTIGKVGGPWSRIERYQAYDLTAAPKTEAECGSGNVEKGLHAIPDLGLNKSYIDTIVVTATPL